MLNASGQLRKDRSAASGMLGSRPWFYATSGIHLHLHYWSSHGSSFDKWTRQFVSCSCLCGFSSTRRDSLRFQVTIEAMLLLQSLSAAPAPFLRFGPAHCQARPAAGCSFRCAWVGPRDGRPKCWGFTIAFRWKVGIEAALTEDISPSTNYTGTRVFGRFIASSRHKACILLKTIVFLATAPPESLLISYKERRRNSGTVDTVA